MRFYDQNQYAEALAEYQAAYRLQPYPLILFNIARLHHKQSHLAEAESYYRRYLDSADPERAERAAQLLSEVKRAQSEPVTGAAASQTPAPPPPAAAAPPLAPSPDAAAPALAPPPPPAASLAPPSSGSSPALLPLSAPVALPAAAEASRSQRPLYKQWWIWTLAGVTVAGVATAVGLGVYSRGPDTTGLPAQTLSFGN